MKVAWAKAKKTEVSLEQMREKYPQKYQATFEQYLSNFPSIIEDSVEQATDGLQDMIEGLQVNNVDWNTEVPVISFTLDLKQVDLTYLVKLSQKAREAKKSLDTLIGAGYSSVTYNGRSLLSKNKPVKLDQKLWRPLEQFIRQAFWNKYVAIYENRVLDLEDSFLEENDGILYAV